eukprot:TRINITY_DN5458_c0_g1_i2.p1 TRINITY_DN5458_c0_g1~~TRINITY_DN5458_c0_g1_i2.p1  ORF type:complete len:158 (+),score=24.71 TRINITY_DN5458_c0_g1_i2:36-509(+)
MASSSAGFLAAALRRAIRPALTSLRCDVGRATTLSRLSGTHCLAASPIDSGLLPLNVQVRFKCERKFVKKKNVDTKSLPFLVKRTPSGNLPVYVHATKKGDKITRVRGVFGDAEHLAGEIGRVCEANARIGVGGRKAVEIPGIHEERIKGWLQQLGL